MRLPGGFPGDIAQWALPRPRPVMVMVTDGAEAGTENEPVQGQPGRVTLYGLGTRTGGVTGGLR